MTELKQNQKNKKIKRIKKINIEQMIIRIKEMSNKILKASYLIMIEIVKMRKNLKTVQRATKKSQINLKDII